MFKCKVCESEFETEHGLKVHLINDHQNWEEYDGKIIDSFGCGDQITRVKVIVDNCEGTVLDVGGGDGNISKAIQDAGHKVMFTDIAQRRVDFTKEKFGIEGIKAAADKLPFNDRSFDTVLCAECLEHIRPMGVALQELIRVARKKIIITMPISDLWDMDESHQWKMRMTIISRDGKSNVLHNKVDDTKASFVVWVMERINGND